MDSLSADIRLAPPAEEGVGIGPSFGCSLEDAAAIGGGAVAEGPAAVANEVLQADEKELLPHGFGTALLAAAFIQQNLLKVLDTYFFFAILWRQFVLSN